MSKPLAWALLALLIFGAYVNALDNAFVFDDFLFIESETIRRPIERWPSFFTLHRHKRIYRPLRTFSYAIDYQLGGDKPFAYHVTNVVYHWLAACLVFVISRLLLIRLWNRGEEASADSRAPPGNVKQMDWLAFGIAAVWAVHPIQTDAVAYVSGRRDILAGVFFFMGMYAFLRLRGTVSRRFRWLWAGCSLGAFFLGALSKEVVLIFPAVFFVYDVCREYNAKSSVWNNVKQTCWSHRWLYLPFLPVGLLGAGYYWPYLSQILKWHGGGPLATWSTIPRIWLHYIQLLIFPYTLNADYSNAFPVSLSLWEGRALFAFVAIAGVLASLVWALQRGKRLIAFGGLWFFVTLLPMSQIIPHHELLAEHYLYIPSFGFTLLVGIGLSRLSQDWGKAVGVGVCLVLLVGYGWRTVIRNQDWQDEVSLWQKTVQTAPTSYRAHHNLGMALKDTKNDRDGAKQAFRQAIEIHPSYASPHTGLAEMYLEELRYDDALRMAKKAVEAKPRRVWSLWILSQVHYKRGEYEDALPLLHKIVALETRFRPAYQRLVHLYRLIGKEKDAREWHKKMPGPDQLPPIFRTHRRDEQD